MPNTEESRFTGAWADLHAAARRSLELAFESLIRGGLAVGSALTDADGRIVAEGRNRAYDPPGGTDRLQGTPLAHAEMNVLAAVRTERDLASCTLWSTQEPCSMCTAAAAFTGVGTIRYIAPDPWAIAAGAAGAAASGGEAPRVVGPAEDRWVVAADLLFMLGVGLRHGPEHPTIARNREREPETAALVLDLLERPDTRSRIAAPATLERLLDPMWQQALDAAAGRAARRG